MLQLLGQYYTNIMEFDRDWIRMGVDVIPQLILVLLTEWHKVDEEPEGTKEKSKKDAGEDSEATLSGDESTMKMGSG